MLLSISKPGLRRSSFDNTGVGEGARVGVSRTGVGVREGEGVGGYVGRSEGGGGRILVGVGV